MIYLVEPMNMNTSSECPPFVCAMRVVGASVPWHLLAVPAIYVAVKAAAKDVVALADGLLNIVYTR